MVGHVQALLVEVHRVSIDVLIAVSKRQSLDLVGRISLVRLEGGDHIILPIVAIENVMVGTSDQLAVEGQV